MNILKTIIDKLKLGKIMRRTALTLKSKNQIAVDFDKTEKGLPLEVIELNDRDKTEKGYDILLKRDGEYIKAFYKANVVITELNNGIRLYDTNEVRIIDGVECSCTIAHKSWVRIITFEEVTIIPPIPVYVQKTNRQILGEKIRNARIAKNLSQMEVAKMIKASPAYVSQIERTGNVGLHHTFITLCEVLGLDEAECLKLAK